LKVTIKGLFLALGVAGLVSCGSGDEAGGGGQCGGAVDSGICLSVDFITPVDGGAGPLFTVDTIVSADCDGDPATVDPEVGIFDHTADATFSAFLVNPAQTTPTQITITSYDVTYQLAPGSADPGPVIPPRVGLGTAIVIAVGGTLPAVGPFALFDIAQKTDPAIGGAIAGGDHPSYIVTYVFRGTDEFDEDVDVIGSTLVNIGDYLQNC
jgi:hypothetical protein